MICVRNHACGWMGMWFDSICNTAVAALCLKSALHKLGCTPDWNWVLGEGRILRDVVCCCRAIRDGTALCTRDWDTLGQQEADRRH